MGIFNLRSIGGGSVTDAWSKEQKSNAKCLAKVLNPCAKDMLRMRNARKTLPQNRRPFVALRPYTPIVVEQKCSFPVSADEPELKSGTVSAEERASLDLYKKNASGVSEADQLREMGISSEKIAAAQKKALHQRKARNYLLQNIPQDQRKYFALVGQDNFTHALHKSVHKFLSVIGDSKYQVLSCSMNKSESWVTGTVLQKYALFQPEGQMTAHSYKPYRLQGLMANHDYVDEQPLHKKVFMELTDYAERTFYKHHDQFVIFDDASYSGKQLFSQSFSTVNDTLSVIAAEGKPYKPITVHFVVPFISNKARVEYQNFAKRWKGQFDFKLHSHGHIAHSREHAGIPKDMTIPQGSTDFAAIEHTVLFAHKIADETSLGSDVALERSGSVPLYKTSARRNYNRSDLPW